MRILLSFLLSLFVLGCATIASNPSQSHNFVPPERILYFPTVMEPSPFAKVSVVRDRQFKGGGLTTTLTFNGKDAANIRSGEKVTFRVEPGEHLLGLRFLGNDPILGALTLGMARPKRFIESATRFEAGREYLFRIVDNANWEWDLKRSSY